MKATLEFTLPDDQDAYAEATMAPFAFSAIRDFQAWLRGKLKHEDVPVAVYGALEEVRERLFLILDEYGVRPD